MKTEIEDKQAIKAHYAQQVTSRTKSTLISRSELDGPLDTSTNLGLPPLEYGTVNDPLPGEEDGWTSMTAYPNLGNFYVGNMNLMAADAPFFPASLPSDGLLDLVTIDGDIGRMKAVGLLLSVPKGTFFDQPCVRIRKVKAIRVIPRFGPLAPKEGSLRNVARQNKLGKTIDKLAPAGSGRNASKAEGYFSVDGEKLPFKPFQVEVHRGLGTVLSRRVGVYEATGPSGWKDIDVQQGG